VEGTLVLIVAHAEVLTATFKLLLNHGKIILLQCIVEWQGAVIVGSVWSRVNLVNDRVLLMHADNVLNSASFKVLNTSSLIILISAHKPAEDGLITVPCTGKQDIFSLGVFHSQRLQFIVGEDLCYSLQILLFDSQMERGFTVKVLQ